MAEFNAMDTAAFKGVWVFCEQREGQIQTISYQLLSEGRKLANDLGVELCGVVMGSELNEDYVKALESGQFDLYLAEVYLTADFDLTSLVSPQGELNYGGWNDAAVPLLLENVRKAQGEQRVTTMATLLRYLNQNAPIAPICFREGTVLTQYDRVENLSPVQGNVFSNLSQWTVK